MNLQVVGQQSESPAVSEVRSGDTTEEEPGGAEPDSVVSSFSVFVFKF